MKAGKVVGIKDAIATMKSSEVLEVLIRPNFERILYDFIEDGRYEVLGEIESEDEIRVRIDSNLKERKRWKGFNLWRSSKRRE